MNVRRMAVDEKRQVIVVSDEPGALRYVAGRIDLEHIDRSGRAVGRRTDEYLAILISDFDAEAIVAYLKSLR